jgi:hypothetical protein
MSAKQTGKYKWLQMSDSRKNCLCGYKQTHEQNQLFEIWIDSLKILKNTSAVAFRV